MNPQLGLALSERALGHQIVTDLARLRRSYLATIRGRMFVLWMMRVDAHGREKAFVTPDDARAYFESLAPPPPEELSRNFLAGVWKEKGWKKLSGTDGTYYSETKGSHGNELKKYAWGGVDQ